jgi:hypothetical protein
LKDKSTPSILRVNPQKVSELFHPELHAVPETKTARDTGDAIHFRRDLIAKGTGIYSSILRLYPIAALWKSFPLFQCGYSLLWKPSTTIFILRDVMAKTNQPPLIA